MKKTTAKFDNFDESMRRIKVVIGKESDRQVALAIGISPDSLIQLRKRGSYPYSKVIEYCIKNKISLDYILCNDEVQITKEIEEQLALNSPLIKFKESSDVFEMKTINLENSIVLPVFDIIVYRDSYKAYVDNLTIFIIDTDISSITKNGTYLIKNNEIYYVKDVSRDFSSNYTFKEELQDDIVLKSDELIKIEVFGSVVFSFFKA